MDTFEYITGLVAVVIGLAIADLATSGHGRAIIGAVLPTEEALRQDAQAAGVTPG